MEKYDLNRKNNFSSVECGLQLGESSLDIYNTVELYTKYLILFTWTRQGTGKNGSRKKVRTLGCLVKSYSTRAKLGSYALEIYKLNLGV